MTRWKIGYKVVMGPSSQGGFTSLYRTDIGCGVNFLIGVRTYPRKGCGPVTLFKSLAGARYTLRVANRSPVCILKCRYSPANEAEVWDTYSLKRITVKVLEKDNRRILLPGETVLANWVTPLSVEEAKSAY